ncbi:MAG TPA: tetratricopeptide repeat protein [Firmicutes bacterium]|nr:tetratricopeptide repeat protein [Bacillota bacterium]
MGVGILVLVLLMGLGMPVAAQEPEALFVLANERYLAGDYAGAIEYYEELVDLYPSANVYYNLGNAYYRQGKLGYAILNYQRAQRLAPRDRDIAHNLEYLRSQVPGEQRWEFRHLFEPFTWRELQALLVISYLMLLTAGLLVRKRTAPWKATLVLTGMLLVFAGAGLLVRGLSSPYGVVVEEVAARFAPQLQGTVHFSLPEGALVSILEEQGDWYLIKQQDQRRGWIPKSACELL